MIKGIDKDRSSVVNNVRVGKVIDGRFYVDIVDDKKMVVPQEVGMSEKADHLLEFNSTIEGKRTSILSIDKKKEGNGYTINLPDLNLFKDADGNSIEGLLGESGLTSQLDITPDENNNLSVQNDNGEIKFTIKAKSGKTYTITTNATGVNIRCEDDGKDYSFKAEREAGVGIDMHTDIVEEFLDKDKPFCQVPDSFEAFPSQFLTLYATRQQASDNPKQLGDFTINSIGGFWDSKQEAAQFPFVFFTKNDDPVPRLVLNGSLKRCESFYLQYDEKGVPKIVFKIKKTAGDKTPDYYAFDLKRDEKGNLTPESMAAIKRIEKLGVKLERENQTSPTKPIGDGKDQYTFEEKDSKTYTKNFRVGINDRDLRLETADAQGSTTPPKKDRKIQGTRSHAVNTVTITEKVGDEEHPIMKDGKPWVVKQEVGMSESASHLFDFWQDLEQPPTEEGGKPTTKRTSLLTIGKDEKTDTYSISLPNLNLFKDREGNALPDDLFALIDGVPTLTVTPPESELNVEDKKGQMCFTITAKDNKTYVISTSATGISITCKDDGKVYGYHTDKANGIGVDMNTNVISECFNTDKKFCHTPKHLRDFPSQILNLYATRLQGSQVIKEGDVQFTAIDNAFWDKSHAKKNEATKHPFVFASQLSTNETFMISNGYMRRCENFYLQYDPETKTPRIVFKLTAVGSENTPQYYAFDLQTNKDGSLTDESMAAIRTIAHLPGTKLEQQTGRNIDSTTFSGIPFEEKDTKEYSTNFNVQVNNREYNQDGLIEDTTQVETEPEPPLVDPGPSGDGGGSGGGGTKKPKVEPPGGDDGGDTHIVEPDPVEEKPKDDDEDTRTVDPDDNKPNYDPNKRPEPTGNIPGPSKPVKKPKPKRKLIAQPVKDYSTYADAFGTAFAYLGVFIAIGALLTGIGLLGIIGLAIAGAGTLTTTFSDKFKYTPYKVAMDKVADLENKEAEDEEGAENFLAKENDLTKATEQSTHNENKLESMIGSQYGDFRDAYNEYGVGFTNGPVKLGPDGNPLNISRTSQMVGPDGLHIKQAMLNQLNLIQQAQNEEERNERIEEFMDSNFKAMPPETRQKARDDLFGPQTKPADMTDKQFSEVTSQSREKLGKFISQLSDTVNAQQQEHDIQVEQEKIIGTARDRQLRKMFCSSRMEEEQTLNMVDRYAHVLARRLANDENFNEDKLDKIFGSLSPETKSVVYRTIINAGQEVSQSIDAIDRDAQDNREIVANIKQAGEYIKTNGFAETIKDLESNSDKYSNKLQATASIKHVIWQKTLLAHSATKSPISYLDSSIPSTPDVKAARSVSMILSNSEGLTNLNVAASNLRNFLFKGYGSIFETYLTGDAPESLLPDLDKILKSGKVGTIEELAGKLANKEGTETQKQLAELLDKFNEAKNAIKNSGKALSPKVAILRRSLEANNILEGAGISEEDFDKLVAKKVKEIEKKSFVKEHLTKGMDKTDKESLLSEIARATLLAETAAKHSTSDDDKKKYNGMIEVLNGVVSGTLAESVIDNQIILGLGGNRINDDTLAQSAKAAKTRIAGYREAIKLIDKLGLSTEVPPAEEGKPPKKSERQAFIEKFNQTELVGEQTMSQVLVGMINDHFGNKHIEPNGPTYSELLAKSKDDKGNIDLKKANKLLNQYITRVNSRAEREAHCNDGHVGSDFTTQELKRRKKQHNKGKVESKENNIYDVIANLTKANKIPLMEDMVIKHPNWSAKKLAKKLGVDKSKLKAEMKKMSNPISENLAQEIWVKQKENKIFKDASDDFESAWKGALTGDMKKIEQLKQFVEAAKNSKKIKTERKEKYTKKQLSKLSSCYAEILERTGLSLDNLAKILEGKDPATISATLSQLNERDPIGKVESMQEQRTKELASLKLKATAPKTARNAMNAAEIADQFASDQEEFNTKVDFITSLRQLNYPKEKIEETYQAFIRGDQKYFAENHIMIDGKEYSLNNLLAEQTKGKYSFDGKESEMLHRLKIKPKDLAKQSARKKNLKRIKRRIRKLDKELAKLKKETRKKAEKTKKGTSAKIKNPNKMKDNMAILQTETGKAKAKTDVEVRKNEEERRKQQELEEAIKKKQQEIEKAKQKQATAESESANENNEEQENE